MFGSKSRKIARLEREVLSLQSEILPLTIMKKTYQDGVKEAEGYWHKHYVEINDRYTLLDSLLKQLRVNVTLPAKKTARQN